jgi:hypothetical protein
MTLSVTDYTPSYVWTILSSELEGIWKIKINPFTCPEGFKRLSLPYFKTVGT